ncbi:ribosome maturation factor RimP [Streptomyces montanisoli]|uniref:Ribosome maturation factor RimP n=1 Tax=Streptomyces montanisoli TaxID=2798581 RepID=A0A940MBV9_9ACTN|nr:ribosome maturation factor RimP [Streptomyces montanisoli]MBP0456166.1 ribosome maturation factor RimP [Streptomyces montanisoli]
MSTTQSDRLRGLLEPLAGAQGLDLEEVELTRAGRYRVLRVVVDAEEGVDLDTVAELTRTVSAELDETDAMGDEQYQLEVTSPGAERPLTERRHYARAVGRLARIRLHEGGEVVARILSVDDEGLDVEVPGVKGRKPTARRLGFSEIAKARVEVEFNRKDKSKEEA